MPARVKDDAGAWMPIDNTLTVRPDGSVGPIRPATPMTFSGGGDAPLAQIADGERSMSMSWPHGDLPAPVLTGTVAKYSSVLPGVDLVAQAGPAGFHTFVVVQSAQAAQHPAVQDLAFDVAADGVSVSDAAEGGLSATDGAETVFSAASPTAWDSEGISANAEAALSAEEQAAGAPLSAPIKAEMVEMTMEASDSEISLSAEEILNDPDTVFPAVLDPSVTRDDYMKWAMIWSSGTTFWNSGSEHARVGRDGWSGSPKTSRVYYEMDVPLSVIDGTMIDSATFSHKLIHSPNHNCDLDSFGPKVQVYETASFAQGISWSNQPVRDGLQDEDNEAHGHDSYCPGDTRQEWDVKEAVEDAVADNDGSMYLMMRSADEADRDGWRKYDNTSTYPELTVEYFQHPPAPDSVSVSPVRTTPAHGSWSSTTRPTLSAAGIEDPNGGNAYARFEIRDSGVAIWDGVSSGGSDAGHTASVQVPSGVLANGEDYSVRAWAAADEDGEFDSEDYVTTTFSVDTSIPAPPAVTQIGDCTVGTMCAFTFAGGTDVSEYKHGMNTDALPTETPKSAAPSQPVSMQANIFGPSWVTAKTVDRAGNTSAARVLNFIVKSTSMSHKWSLDGGGALTGAEDSGDPGGTLLAFPAGSAWDAGVSAPGGANLGFDAADKAFSGGAGRYASAGSASTGLTHFSTGDDFSAAAWVKLPAGASESVALSQAGASGAAFTLGYADGNWVFSVKGGDDAGAPLTVSAPASGAAGRWVHLAAVYNNESTADVEEGEILAPRRITLYVDGRPAATVEENVPAVFRATRQLLIGRGTAAGAAVGAWGGLIDDVRLFPGVIDDSQVKRIAAERRPT